MVNGVSKPKPGWLTRVTEEASYGHWASSPHIESRSLARMDNCTLSYFSKAYSHLLSHPVTNIWRRKWQPTPVFLPGESQGRASLVGCRLWGCTESDTTEAT